MTAPALATVDCPVCGGGGELVDCPGSRGYRCSHENDRTYPCHGCGNTGGVPETSVDREGALITFDGCQCDMDEPCSDATCQMQRDVEMRRAFASYRADVASRSDIDWMTFAEQMTDAGRAHLLRHDERMPF